MVGDVAGVTVGILGTVAIPQLVLGANNIGTTALMAEAGVALGLGLLSNRVSKKFGQQVMVGGFAAMLANAGSQMLGIAPTATSGTLGFYIDNGFPLPTSGRGPYLLNDSGGASPTANADMNPPVVLPIAPKKSALSNLPHWLPWAAAGAAALLMAKEA
jgi:hypothetical protein